MNTDSLSPNERRAIDAALVPLSEQAKFPLSLDRLLQRWYKFVAQIEQGYTDSIYEYMNDLSSRDVIEKVLSGVSEPLRSKLVTLVQPGDERFEQATREIDRALSGRKDIETHPWWFRIPKRVGGELDNDLRVRGVLDVS